MDSLKNYVYTEHAAERYRNLLKEAETYRVLAKKERSTFWTQLRAVPQKLANIFGSFNTNIADLGTRLN